MFYAWTPTLSTLLPEANSQRARTKPDLLNSIPQRSESGDFLHAHRLCPYSLWYDKLPRIYHSCFRLLNAEMTRENKGTTMCFLPIQRIIIQFLYVLDKWENSKKKKISQLSLAYSEESQHLHSWYGAHYIIIKDWEFWVMQQDGVSVVGSRRRGEAGGRHRKDTLR